MLVFVSEVSPNRLPQGLGAWHSVSAEIGPHESDSMGSTRKSNPHASDAALGGRIRKVRDARFKRLVLDYS